MAFMKVCKECGKTFTTRSKIALYCSRECYHKHSRLRIENEVRMRTCAVCGKEFRVQLRSDRTWSEARCCSEECTKILGQQNMQKTLMEKYGVTNSMQIEETKRKFRETCLRKYGVPSYTQTEEFKERYKETSLKKFGVENCMQLEEIQQKSQETCLAKYGVKSYTQTEECRQKREQTCLKRYGETTNLKTKEFNEKAKQTYLRKYGIDWYSKSKEYKDRIIEKMDEINAKRLSKIEQTQNKRFQTMKRNGTFKASKYEDLIYNILKDDYNNVEREYKSEKYPWKCDFYIPDLDLFLEYQGHWSHNFCAFDKTNKEHIEKLNEYKNKVKEVFWYNRLIDVWATRDVIKREWAKEYNLNWVEFFNFDEFLNWYNTFKMSILGGSIDQGN